MTTIDAQALFASGPHSLRPGTPQRRIVRRGLPGLDGELALDMGLRSRRLVHTGRLQGQTAQEVADQLAAIEARIDGRTHLLADDRAGTFPRVLIESCEPTAIRRGRRFWCDYEIVYRQLP